MPGECAHARTIRNVTPSALGCEECLKLGSAWVHLRLCRTCGQAIFALLALITGLVALYVRLEPDYGAFQALNIVGGVLAVIALVLISAAMIVGRASSRRH
jgi:hypothetical protein